MKNIIKDSFVILKNNMLFIQPLILWLLFFLIALPHLMHFNGNIIAQISLSLSVALMTIAFGTGWLYINHLAIHSFDPADKNEEITVKSIENFKKFFTGVGKYFTKMLSAGIIISACYYGTLFLFKNIYKATSLFQTLQGINNFKTEEELLAFLSSLSTIDKLTFVKLFLMLVLITIVLNYLCTLFFASIFFDKKNIFVCFYRAIKFFFAHFFTNICLMTFLFFINMAITSVSGIFGRNTISATLYLLLLTLFINYYILTVFRFYDGKTKDNSNNRTEFIG